MLVVEFPERSLAQNEIPVGHFKINYHIAAFADGLSHRRDKITNTPKMFKHMTTDDYICRLIDVFCRVVIRNKTDISWNVVVRLRSIARANADTEVVSTIANYSQEVALTASDFDNAFVVQIVLRD
jgi:hypothetical protein